MLVCLVTYADINILCVLRTFIGTKCVRDYISVTKIIISDTANDIWKMHIDILVHIRKRYQPSSVPVDRSEQSLIIG